MPGFLIFHISVKVNLSFAIILQFVARNIVDGHSFASCEWYDLPPVVQADAGELALTS
jgi:hypothetical protein